MPAYILFGSLKRGKEATTERIKVEESAAAVAKALGRTDGFADFQESGKNGAKVWVHAGQVRAVREA